MSQDGANRITFAGDVMPGRKVAASLSCIGLSEAAARVRAVLGEGLAVGNLECPLTDQPPAAAHKADGGPNLHAPPGMALWLRQCGFRVVTLANNHAMDAGPDGLLATLDALRHAGLTSVGAGANLEEALRPAVLDVAGQRVAIVAFGNGPPAGKAAPGVAPFQSAALRIAVSRARRQADAVVVVMHVGLEFLQHPESWTRQFAQEALVLGADAVIGGHPHCIRGVWRSARGPVAYSLGDFLMDTADTQLLEHHIARTALTQMGFEFDTHACRHGLLADLTITPARPLVCSIRPIVIGDDFLPRPPRRAEQEGIEAELSTLSADLHDPHPALQRVQRGIERAYRSTFQPRGLGEVLSMPLRLRPRHLAAVWRRVFR